VLKESTILDLALTTTLKQPQNSVEMARSETGADPSLRSSRVMVNPVSTRGIVTDGDLAANAASFARHLRAANLTPATQRAYLDGLTLLARFLTDAGICVLARR